MEYSHADHGKIEQRVLSDRIHDDITVVRCADCGVAARLENADTVFSTHECDQYATVADEISF